MKTYLFLFSTFFFFQCSSPKSSFIIDSEADRIAPARLSFKSTSTNAEMHEWRINGEELGKEASLDYIFNESGKYTITLIVKKGEKKNTSAKELVIEAPEKCRILMVTDMGSMTFELYEDTPNHLIQFNNLVDDEYYNGLSFHRVMQGFMIQAGDNATRVDNYKKAIYPDIPSEFNTDHLHYKGVLAAARMPNNINPEKASSGTQFYIVHGRQINREELMGYNDERSISYREDQIQEYIKRGGAPQLDFEYTVFGEMIDGFETLDKIARVETSATDKPIDDVRIIDISIIK